MRWSVSIPLTTHHSPLTTHHSPLTTHHSPLTTHHSPLTTHHSPLTTHHSPLTTHHSPLTTHHSPLTTHHSPLTTHHSPLTTHHSPLTTHHSPLTTLLPPVQFSLWLQYSPSGNEWDGIVAEVRARYILAVRVRGADNIHAHDLRAWELPFLRLQHPLFEVRSPGMSRLSIDIPLWRRALVLAAGLLLCWAGDSRSAPDDPRAALPADLDLVPRDA